jgi:hypothetical protein
MLTLSLKRLKVDGRMRCRRIVVYEVTGLNSPYNMIAARTISDMNLLKKKFRALIVAIFLPLSKWVSAPEAPII